jgi:acyl-CoA thioester hydrolase
MPEPRAVELRLRVRYAETDQGGVAYYANYFVWFEMGRSEYCRAVGYPYTKIEEQGYLMVVAEATARYKRSVRYDDPLIVRTTMPEIRRRVCRFGYQIINEDSGEPVAEGETTHVVVDMKSGRPTALPDNVVNYFLAARDNRKTS